jgi:hypothetical protein
MIPPKLQRRSAKAIKTLLVSNPRHPTNEISFSKAQIAWWDHLHISSNSPSLEQVKALSQENSISICVSQVTVYKLPLTRSSYALHMQEWCNLLRDDILHLQRTTHLDLFLTIWCRLSLESIIRWKWHWCKPSIEFDMAAVSDYWPASCHPKKCMMLKRIFKSR